MLATADTNEVQPKAELKDLDISNLILIKNPNCETIIGNTHK